MRHLSQGWVVLKKSGIPVIFYQVGDFSNVSYKRFSDVAVCQATLASPNSDIILLTDEIRSLPFNVTQALVRDYWGEVDAFVKEYVHVSINPVQYEAHCYIRWFVIREFVRKHGISNFCYFDSDVLIFSPVERFAAEFRGCSAGNWSWANFFAEVDVLDVMCDYFHNVFRDRDLLESLVEQRRRVSGFPDLSDMNLLVELSKSNGTFLDQKDFPFKGYDQNIRESENGYYLMDEGIKLLNKGPEGIFTAHRSQDSSEVPFHFLHFQGQSKYLMALFAWRVPVDSAANFQIRPNAECPCLGGKRWKHCHGRFAA
jgi:hypothetical protein